MHILKYRSCMSKEEIDMVSIDKLYKLVLLLLLATNISVVSSCNLLANGGVPEIEGKVYIYLNRSTFNYIPIVLFNDPNQISFI